jgi:hypothetical protein
VIRWPLERRELDDATCVYVGKLPDELVPDATNLVWTHEVPHSAKVEGRRISITGRAFED